MSAVARESAGQDLGPLRRAVDRRLADFLDSKAAAASRGGALPADVVEEVRGFLFAGGKRLRPLMCLLGWHAACGRDTRPPDPVLGVAASLEMFHAFALIHDDLMDGSRHRRGRETLQHLLAARHTRQQARQPMAAADRAARSQRAGEATAILIGDLALAWSDELLHTAGLTPVQWQAVRPLVDTMRTEVMTGQYLDITSTGKPSADVSQALTIARYKTATYTVERPLHLGGAMAGAEDAFMSHCTAVGLPLGEAFQLRDDLLGVFGDPALTGKSRLEDLRDGKATVLMALAARAASPSQLRVLEELVGNRALDETAAARVRDVLVATGAAADAEAMIADRLLRAHTAMDAAAFPDPVAGTLRRIIDSQHARAA